MIFILEDDEGILSLVLYALNSANLKAKGFSLPKEFWEAMAKEEPSCVVLDVMLPQEDGLSVLRKMRQNHKTKNIPVIMLTALGSEFDKIKGLDSGADDYLTKPFSALELIARIKALLRRSHTQGDLEMSFGVIMLTALGSEFDKIKGLDSGADDYLTKPFSALELIARIKALLRRSHTQGDLEMSFGDLKYSKTSHSVSISGESLHLTLKEFELLGLLMNSPNRVFTREELLEIVWGYNISGTRTIDIHINTLRSKLGKYGKCIKTIRGVGYQFSGDL